MLILKGHQRNQSAWGKAALLLLFLGFLACSSPSRPGVIGYVERYRVFPENFPLSGKNDTGAKMTSLSAVHIVTKKRQGQRWVEFDIVDPVSHKVYPMKRPLVRFTHIKQRRDEIKTNDKDEDADADASEEDEEESLFASRPVVELELCLGGRHQTVLVNLVDRTHFVYPLLIGRDAIRMFDKVVDPTLKRAVKPGCGVS